jgi:hypothetical protein
MTTVEKDTRQSPREGAGEFERTHSDNVELAQTKMDGHPEVGDVRLMCPLPKDGYSPV